MTTKNGGKIMVSDCVCNVRLTMVIPRRCHIYVLNMIDFYMYICLCHPLRRVLNKFTKCRPPDGCHVEIGMPG